MEIEGWLHKQAEKGVVRSWKRRYFRLEKYSNEIVYFKSSDDKGGDALEASAWPAVSTAYSTHVFEPGSIPLGEITAVPKDSDASVAPTKKLTGGGFTIETKGPKGDRVYVLCTDEGGAESRERWITTITDRWTSTRTRTATRPSRGTLAAPVSSAARTRSSGTVATDAPSGRLRARATDEGDGRRDRARGPVLKPSSVMTAIRNRTPLRNRDKTPPKKQSESSSPPPSSPPAKASAPASESAPIPTISDLPKESAKEEEDLHDSSATEDSPQIGKEPEGLAIDERDEKQETEVPTITKIPSEKEDRASDTTSEKKEGIDTNEDEVPLSDEDDELATIAQMAHEPSAAEPKQDVLDEEDITAMDKPSSAVDPQASVSPSKPRPTSIKDKHIASLVAGLSSAPEEILASPKGHGGGFGDDELTTQRKHSLLEERLGDDEEDEEKMTAAPSITPKVRERASAIPAVSQDKDVEAPSSDAAEQLPKAPSIMHILKVKIPAMDAHVQRTFKYDDETTVGDILKKALSKTGEDDTNPEHWGLFRQPKDQEPAWYKKETALPNTSTVASHVLDQAEVIELHRVGYDPKPSLFVAMESPPPSEDTSKPVVQFSDSPSSPPARKMPVTDEEKTTALAKEASPEEGRKSDDTMPSEQDAGTEAESDVSPPKPKFAPPTLSREEFEAQELAEAKRRRLKAEEFDREMRLRRAKDLRERRKKEEAAAAVQKKKDEEEAQKLKLEKERREAIEFEEEKRKKEEEEERTRERLEEEAENKRKREEEEKKREEKEKERQRLDEERRAQELLQAQKDALENQKYNYLAGPWFPLPLQRLMDIVSQLEKGSTDADSDKPTALDLGYAAARAVVGVLEDGLDPTVQPVVKPSMRFPAPQPGQRERPVATVPNSATLAPTGAAMPPGQMTLAQKMMGPRFAGLKKLASQASASIQQEAASVASRTSPLVRSLSPSRALAHDALWALITLSPLPSRHPDFFRHCADLVKASFPAPIRVPVPADAMPATQAPKPQPRDNPPSHPVVRQPSPQKPMPKPRDRAGTVPDGYTAFSFGDDDEEEDEAEVEQEEEVPADTPQAPAAATAQAQSSSLHPPGAPVQPAMIHATMPQAIPMSGQHRPVVPAVNLARASKSLLVVLGINARMLSQWVLELGIAVDAVESGTSAFVNVNQMYAPGCVVRDPILWAMFLETLHRLDAISSFSLQPDIDQVTQYPGLLRFAPAVAAALRGTFESVRLHLMLSQPVIATGRATHDVLAELVFRKWLVCGGASQPESDGQVGQVKFVDPHPGGASSVLAQRMNHATRIDLCNALITVLMHEFRPRGRFDVFGGRPRHIWDYIVEASGARTGEGLHRSMHGLALRRLVTSLANDSRIPNFNMKFRALIVIALNNRALHQYIGLLIDPTKQGKLLQSYYEDWAMIKHAEFRRYFLHALSVLSHLEYQMNPEYELDVTKHNAAMAVEAERKKKEQRDLHEALLKKQVIEREDAAPKPKDSATVDVASSQEAIPVAYPAPGLANNGEARQDPPTVVTDVQRPLQMAQRYPVKSETEKAGGIMGFGLFAEAKASVQDFINAPPPSQPASSAAAPVRQLPPTAQPVSPAQPFVAIPAPTHITAGDVAAPDEAIIGGATVEDAVAGTLQPIPYVEEEPPMEQEAYEWDEGLVPAMQDQSGYGEEDEWLDLYDDPTQ